MFAARRRGGRPKKRWAGVPHLVRPALAHRFPVHVTMRVRRGVGFLRTRQCFSALKRAFFAGGRRERFRLVGYSVQADHLHFLVEGADREALLRNHAHHYEQRRGFALPRHHTDPYADVATTAAHTWLMREGWRRAPT